MLIKRFASFRDVRLYTQYSVFDIDNLQDAAVSETFLCSLHRFVTIEINGLDLFAHLHRRLSIEEKSHSQLFL
jgi:hypothetical protein